MRIIRSSAEKDKIDSPKHNEMIHKIWPITCGLIS